MSLLRGRHAFVAMSGGVDSSVAATHLVQEGYDVVGVTMRVIPPATTPPALAEVGAADHVDAARRVTEALGIPHHVVDVSDPFERAVIAYFIEEYRSARTPNPCVRCNRVIKFGLLWDYARERGADFLATGHYARTEARADRMALRRAAYLDKDQSYVLAGLTQEQLGHAHFPLGGQSKADTRQEAAALGLPVAERPESQEICFIPDDDYRRFLEERLGPPEPGPIVSVEGEVLGRHQGLVFYTIGQRRGLGIAAPKPYYVVRMDPARNTLVVGHDEDCLSVGLRARNVNWCSVAALPGPFKCLAQIRYRHTPVRSTVTFDGDALDVRFHEPQRSVTPGQWVALYDDAGYVLAGGIIEVPSRDS